MGNRTVEIIPYCVYGPDGKKEVTSDERCRFSPSMEMSLIDAGHTIKLGGKKITKKMVLERMKDGKQTDNH